LFHKPSQVGIQLQSIDFNTLLNGVQIASVASNGSVSLLPDSTSPLSLAGRLIPQTSPQGLGAVSTVFNNVLHGNDTDVVVQASGVSPSDVKIFVRRLFGVC
jgi:hypothetical protein